MNKSQQSVFISYGHDEYAVLAFHLKEDLEREGFQVWMDKDKIKHTHAWELSIETGLKASQWVIACLTPHAIRRPDGICLDELAAARYSGKSIAPIMVSMVEPPLSLCRIEWLDMQSSLTCENDAYVLNKDTYQKQLKLLLATLRGEHRLNHEGGLAALRSTLRPFDYGVEIDAHVSGFFGREWLFEAFDDWLSLQKNGSDVFWIQGGVGIGKTALAAMLAHKRPEVAGLHFCKASDSERSNPVRILCSLAYQLSTQIPAYQDALLGNPELKRLYEQNATAVFDVLFTNSMRPEWVKDGIKVLIIDALDEAIAGGSKGSLAEVLGHDLRGRIPPWLKLVITSRSNNYLTRELSAFDPLVFSADDQRNREDMLGYALRETEKRLEKAGTDACRKIAQSLTDKSEGCFLYLTMAFAESDRDRLDLTRPDTFPKGLTGLYKHFFDRRFPDPKAYKAHQRPLLELLTAASGPLPIRLAEAVLDWDDYDADDALEPLGALFPVKKDEHGEETLEPFHRSIVEWVQDRALSGREYRVSATKGHERFVEYLYPAFESWQQQGKNDDSGWFFSFLAESLASLKQCDQLKAVISDAHAPSIVDPVTLWGWWRAVGGDSAGSMAGESYLKIKDSEMVSCAGAFLDFIGNYEVAEKLNAYALKMSRELLGDKHPDIASCLHNLAHVFYSQGNYPEAERLYRESLEMRRALLGDKHPDVADSLNNLADVLVYSPNNYRQGNYYTEAEELYREALDMRRELFGEKHPDVADSLNNLAGVLESPGIYPESEHLYRKVEAEQLYNKSLEMRRELLGEKHLDVATSLNNLAGVLESQGNYEEAERLYRESLEMRHELLGEKHPDVARCLNNLAGVLKSQGNYEEAERLYCESLAMTRELLGEKHSDVGSSLNNLAFVLKSQGNYAEAERFYRELLKMKREEFGEKNINVVFSMRNLAGVLNSQSKYEEVEKIYLELLEMDRELLGDKHLRVVRSLNDLAGVLNSQGKFEEAEKLCRESLEMRRELLGDKHPDVAVAHSLNNLAFVLKSQGNYEEAEKLYRESLEMYRELLGDKHPDVATSLNNLAVVLNSQGKHEEAEKLLHEMGD